MLSSFFRKIGELDKPQMLTEECRQDYIYRITQILHCPPGDELHIDEDKAENIPLNSDQPMFLAAEFF